MDMPIIERGALLDCLMPFALYYENKIKTMIAANAPDNTPILDGAFTIGDFSGPWTIMQNDDQAKPVFDAIIKDQKSAYTQTLRTTRC
jgi:hypothetical protein